MGSKKKQTGALIDSNLYRRIKSLSVLHQRRVGDLIDDAISAYLAREPSETKEGNLTKRERTDG